MKRNTFLSRLGFWTAHCTINALPGFCVAVAVAGNSLRNSTSIAAMLVAIGTFIAGLAVLTSLNGPFSDDKHLLWRSLKVGLNVRAVLAVISLMMIWDQSSILLSMDVWCGMGALFAAERIGLCDFSENIPADFATVFGISVLVGLILSFVIAMISFCALIVLQAKDRRLLFRKHAAYQLSAK